MAQKKKAATKKKAGPTGKSNASNNASKIAVTVFSLIAVGVILALCIYFPQICGQIGHGVKGFFLSLLGVPCIFFPFILAALGIYLAQKKDFHKFIIKSIFSFISLALLCGLFYIFGASDIRPIFAAGIPHIYHGGCGYLGFAAAYYIVEWFGNVITAIIFLALLFCLF